MRTSPSRFRRSGSPNCSLSSTGSVDPGFSTIDAPGTVFSMVMSADAKWLAMCSDSATVHVIDIARRQVAHRFKLPRRTIAPVALSPDGRWVAASDQSTTAVWSLSTGVRHIVLKVGAESLAFSSDSRQLAIGGHGTVGVVTVV